MESWKTGTDYMDGTKYTGMVGGTLRASAYVESVKGTLDESGLMDVVMGLGLSTTYKKAGILYEKGGGFSMNPPAGTSGSSRYIQYHPGGGHHGDLPYYKVSSPEHGIIRIYTNGKVVKK
ncbi:MULTISPECIES: hypothetical protein [Listeria]|uniref:hypothetical protein n=1 Tax=Listeria TaxID=1637 RepID=UPI000B590537|nr:MULTISPECIES: hypothetical protein [Listeria]